MYVPLSAGILSIVTLLPTPTSFSFPTTSPASLTIRTLMEQGLDAPFVTLGESGKRLFDDVTLHHCFAAKYAVPDQFTRG